LNGKEKAEAVVEKLLQTDACSANLGLQVIDLDARHAVVSLTVGETMVNGHGVCHGHQELFRLISAVVFNVTEPRASKYRDRTDAFRVFLRFA